jgi:cytidylate kinase
MFPDATLKVFVTASSELRAQRRWEQIGKKGTYEEVLADLIKRDLADTTRVNSPLRQAPDAFVLDTTNLTEDKAIEILLAQFNKRI